jgi:hypothetical protein
MKAEADFGLFILFVVKDVRKFFAHADVYREGSREVGDKVGALFKKIEVGFSVLMPRSTCTVFASFSGKMDKIVGSLKPSRM